MAVKLNDKGAWWDGEVSIPGKLLVDRQRPQVVAGDPEQKVAAHPGLATGGPGDAGPGGIVRHLVEGERLKALRVRVAACPCRQPFVFVVGQHLLEGVGEQEGARPRAAAAEQVERKEQGGGFHVGVQTPCSRGAARRYGAIGTI